MNVYDFDGTIYAGDSTVDFFLYAVKKHPSLLRYVPRQMYGFLLYACRRIDKTQLKEYFYSFLKGIDVQTEVVCFWQTHEKKIYGWYKAQKTAQDIIISASPFFLLQPVCEAMGVCRLIASGVDAKTGKATSANCRGKEKVRRLWQEYQVDAIDRFYSDSDSDLPLACLAKHPYRVKNGIPQPWHTADRQG